MEYDKHGIFLDREKRYVFQKKLIDKYKKTLLSIKINHPSNNTTTVNIIKSMDDIITDIFNDEIYLKIFRITLEGPVVIILLNMDEINAKKICMEIEDKHMLGRCIDVDVYNSNYKLIRRKNFGYKKRRCFVCNDLIDPCVKHKIHTDIEILEKMRKVYLSYVNKYYLSKFNK